MTDAQLQAKAIICAALIQNRAFDVDALGSPNKSISAHKLTHLTELTERIYDALMGPADRGVRTLELQPERA
jgi:hypothetical protein